MGPVRIRQLGMLNSLTQLRSLWVITAFKTKPITKSPFLTSKAMHVDASAQDQLQENNQRRTDRRMGITWRYRFQGSLNRDQPHIFQPPSTRNEQYSVFIPGRFVHPLPPCNTSSKNLLRKRGCIAVQVTLKSHTTELKINGDIKNFPFTIRRQAMENPQKYSKLHM